jgi:hypothetical protein
MTYFHFQMNTVAVTFAQISFCLKFALLVYACRADILHYHESFFLPLLFVAGAGIAQSV